MTDETAQLPERMRHRRRRRLVVVIIFTALIFTTLGWTVSRLGRQADRQEERADNAVSSAEQLCNQIKGLGYKCLVNPDDLKGDQGPQGPAGQNATDAQVRRAVAEYLARNPPPAGRAPNATEIAAAVISYMRANPPAAGPRGPGPSTEQVESAVREYLAANPPAQGQKGDKGDTGDKGDKGEQGDQGPAGADGKPPASWTWTDALGLEHTCTRDKDSPDSAPTYTCQSGSR